VLPLAWRALLAARPGDKPLGKWGALLLLLALVGVPACGSGDNVVDDASLPYSFAYPSDFEAGARADVPARDSALDNQTIIARESGQNFVSVQTYPLREPVSPELVPRINREAEAIARRIGRVRTRRKVRVDGLDGVMFDMRVRGEAGVPVHARSTYAGKGRTLYWINCQWQSDRAPVLRACDKVLRTFRPR
jgi:hypothetical protein